jgi:hypothetical protein
MTDQSCFRSGVTRLRNVIVPVVVFSTQGDKQVTALQGATIGRYTQNFPVIAVLLCL